MHRNSTALWLDIPRYCNYYYHHIWIWLLSLFPFFLFSSSIPLFDPPQGWDCAFPKEKVECVQVGFFGKGSTSFRPSINFAIEEIDVGLKKYLQAAKESQLAEKGKTWRDLGKFTAAAGVGRLIEIGATSSQGPIKMLQMIIVKENHAYILTGACRKEEFVKFQDAFLNTFQSFRLIPDLFSPLPIEEKERFESFFSKKDAKWDDLQKMVQQCNEMGSYWQVLVLQVGQNKLGKAS